MFYLAQAVITKYHDLGGLRTAEISLPQFWGLEG